MDRRKQISLLSLFLILGGIAPVLATVSRPLITITPPTIHGGDTVTFKIFLYLIDENNNPSPLNPNLYKVQVDNIYIIAPDGTTHWMWIGPPKPLTVEVPPQTPGADMSKFISVDFGPSSTGWSSIPDTNMNGKYKVDFDGRYYMSDGEEIPYTWSQYFDVAKEFNVTVPEISEMSVLLVAIGLVLFFLRNRLALR